MKGLEKIAFSESDELNFIGDAIDRGAGNAGENIQS